MEDFLEGSCEKYCKHSDCLDCTDYPPSEAYKRFRAFDADPDCDFDEWLRLRSLVASR